MARRRHQLSSVDLLPPEADVEVSWAIQEIEAGGRLDIDILAEFNARLADRGIGPISKSAFGRYALKKREALSELAEVREIANAVTTALGPGDDDAVTRLIAQQLKARVYGILRKRDDLDARGAKDIGQALQAIANAEQRSSARKDKLEEKVQQRMEKAVEEGVAAVARAKGMSADTAEAIKAPEATVAEVFEELEDEAIVEALEGRLDKWFAEHG